MIIKSMSRKDPSFGQLMNYVSRDASDERFALRHNLMSRDIPAMTAELEKNAQELPKRQNGVIMYHEILSITRSKTITTEAQKDILRDIAQDYLKARAPTCLAFATLHQDKSDQLHYHFVISANVAGSERRHRLSKAEFRKIQVGLEQRVLTQYPELEQKLAIGKKKTTRKLSDDGQQVKRRGQRLTKKERVAATLTHAFQAARDDADLFKRLTDAGFELYTRGNSIGVRDTAKGTNHRLDTLGLTPAFAVMQERFKQAPAVALPPPEIAIAKRSPPMPPHSPPTTKPDQTEQHPSRVARWGRAAAKAAEKALGTVATKSGEAAEYVLGGALKQSVGSLDIAVHTLGGPKPFDPNAKAQTGPAATPQQAHAPVNQAHLDAIKTAMTPLNPATEVERIAAERLKEIEKLQEQNHQRQLKDQNLPGPRQVR
jgi:Relaxase/Mobilisation nuclease domain